MEPVLAVDIGGTHARFAIAQGGALSHVVKMQTAQHATLNAAWNAYADELGMALPKRAGVAVACPVTGDEVKLTNNPWSIKQSKLKAELGLEQLHMLNDFGAVTHAVSVLGSADMVHLTGPDTGLPAQGVVSVVGPGTGLGVGFLHRVGAHDHVIETEGGHIDFAAVDAVDLAILQRLQQRYMRVSAERVVSGPGLAHIYETIAALQGDAIPILDDKALWSQAIDGSNSVARQALERFCMALGTVCGDIALAQGAKAVVLAGGLPPRMLDLLKRSSFCTRFRAKGRFESFMAKLPVYVCMHPDPGLLGAAVALERTPR
jgi:glucokinase